MKTDDRYSTGIVGFDAILRGGLIRGGVYLVTGQPGTGKTIFGNQVCFAHGRDGGKALYCTLLAETHGRMIANIGKLSFYEERFVGERIKYIEGFSTLEKDGLDGALKMLRDEVRDQQATILVIDGTVTAGKMSGSDIAFKKFIQGLKSWVELIDCTVVLLTSSGADPKDTVQPEHTMVDGVFHLNNRAFAMRMLRELCVRKFRGSAYLEGFHSYTITADGIVAWPRLEALLSEAAPAQLSDERKPIGIVALDDMLDGGLRGGSMTLLIGATGAGKTQLGLQFLAAGAAHGERCLYFGLFEPPSLIDDTARRLGLMLDGDTPRLTIVWQPDTERLIDALASDLLLALDGTGATRLLIDGMVAFKRAVADSARMPGFIGALANELRRRGVTTLMTEELREVVDTPLYVPVDNTSASFDNILFLRQLLDGGSIIRHLAVVKTRGADHDRDPRRFDITDAGITMTSTAGRSRAHKKRATKAPKRRR